MSLFIIIGLSAMFFFIVFFVSAKGKNKIIAQAKLKPISQAQGLCMVYGKIGSEKTISSAYSQTECVYDDFKLGFWYEDPEYNEWQDLCTIKNSVPFYIEDGTGRLYVNTAAAELDLYSNYDFDISKYNNNHEALVRLKELSAQHQFTIPKEKKLRVHEKILKVGDSITILSEVSGGAQKQAQIISGVDKFYLSDDTPQKFINRNQRSKKRYLIGMVASSIITLGLIIYSLAT